MAYPKAYSYNGQISCSKLIDNNVKKFGCNEYPLSNLLPRVVIGLNAARFTKAQDSQMKLKNIICCRNIKSAEKYSFLEIPSLEVLYTMSQLQVRGKGNYFLKSVLVVAKPFNIPVNNFGAKDSACCITALVGSRLVISITKCILCSLNFKAVLFILLDHM